MCWRERGRGGVARVLSLLPGLLRIIISHRFLLVFSSSLSYTPLSIVVAHLSASPQHPRQSITNPKHPVARRPFPAPSQCPDRPSPAAPMSLMFILVPPQHLHFLAAASLSLPCPPQQLPQPLTIPSLPQYPHESPSFPSILKKISFPL